MHCAIETEHRCRLRRRVLAGSSFGGLSARWQPGDLLMRVAHVAPRGVHPYSGLLASLVDSATAVAKASLEVEVWQLHHWPERQTAELREALATANVELVPMEADGRRWGFAAVPPSKLRARKIDVAHLHGVFNPTNNLLASELQVPFVISPHGGYAAGSMAYHRGRKLLFKYLFERPMLRRAAAVCALTELEAAEVRRFGVRRPIHVVPNGTHVPAGTLDRAAFRAELGLGTDDRLAVYAGRIDVRAKRLDRIVEAVARTPGWHVALLGGDFRAGVADVIRLADRLGIGERVHLPEARRGRELDEALGGSDVFVLMSRSEGMPMALLEALAAGTPAVISPEVDRSVGMGKSGAGWVVAPEALAGVLNAVGSSSARERAERMASAQAMARRFDWAEVAARHEAIYRQIAGT